MMNQNLVSAVFDSHGEAERAISALRSAGIDDNALSVIAQHDGKTTTTAGDGSVTDDGHTNLLRGIVGGGALGAGIAIAALAIPGVGPLVAAGAIAASAIPGTAVVGAAVGAAVGTLNESLKDHGVDDDDAAYFGESIKGGGVFVSVDTRAANVTADAAREILYRNGGHSSKQARTAHVL